MDSKKILAARKKLKEYQRTKKENLQENCDNHQNEHSEESKDRPTISQKNGETSTISNNDENSSKPSPEQNVFPNSQEIPKANNQDFNIFSDDSNTYSCEENGKSFYDNVDVRNSKMENHGIFPSNENKCESQDLALIEGNFETQKNQISQMLSSVENVLNDGNDGNDGNDLMLISNQNEISRNSSSVEEEKKLENQVTLRNTKITVVESSLSEKTQQYENLQKEVESLRQQLKIHTHTTNILVSEKAQLISDLNQNNTIIQQKSDEISEVLEKLKHSQIRNSELEKELLFVRKNNDDVQKVCQQLQKSFGSVSNEVSELRKVKDDLEMETSELKQKLSVKNSEMIHLQKEFQEKMSLLSLSELKIQQLTNSTQGTDILTSQQNSNYLYEQQITQLKETIKSLGEEKDEANKQYQCYLQQLDEKHSKVTSELSLALKKIGEFENREESYIQRLSDIEQTLQREREKAVSPQSLQEHQQRIEMLTKNIDNLILQQESMQISLNEKDAEIETLRKDLQEVSEPEKEDIDASKLLFALESEQQGAARAVLQNQQLKLQLNEMHDAFVSLSNDKLELTEQLQAERGIGKKMNAMLNKVEEELEEVKAKLAEQENKLSEHEKKEFETALITDQMQHYQAQSHHTNVIQHELTQSLGKIEALEKENKRLKQTINLQSKTMITLEDPALENQDKEVSQENVETPKLERVRKISTETQTSVQTEDENFNIPEPLKKLEEKFKNTMEQVAELTDEKQRLEHLVMQLQGETETIGEYVALYQNQRLVLDNRAKERDDLFRQLYEQRDQQQEQLHKLKILVADLLRSRKISGSDAIQTEGSEAENKEEQSLGNHAQPKENSVGNNIDANDSTASQILDLLTEIKDTNDSCNFSSNFSHCPCCSGKLITV